MTGFAVACSRVSCVRRALLYDMRLGRHRALGAANHISANVSTHDLSAATKEMRAIAALRPEITRPYFRFSISSSHGHLKRSDWSIFFRSVLKRIGFDPSLHLFNVERHPNNEHDHCHCTVTRVSLAGNLVVGEWELKLLIDVVREVAIELGFMQSYERVEGENFRLLRANRIRKRLGLRPMSARRITTELRQCLYETSNREEFFAAAEALGYKLLLSTGPDGHERGLALTVPDTEVKIALSHATSGEMSLRLVDEFFDLVDQAIRQNDEYAHAERASGDRVEPDSVRVDNVSGTFSAPTAEHEQQSSTLWLPEALPPLRSDSAALDEPPTVDRPVSIDLALPRDIEGEAGLPGDDVGDTSTRSPTSPAMRVESAGIASSQSATMQVSLPETRIQKVGDIKMLGKAHRVLASGKDRRRRRARFVVARAASREMRERIALRALDRAARNPETSSASLSSAVRAK